MKCSFDISSFLEEIFSLSHSIVFLYFFALFIGEAFLSLLGILWKSAFSWVYLSLSPLLFASLLSLAICKISSNSLPPCILFLGDGFGHCLLYNVRVPLSIILQALCLSDLIPWIYLSFLPYNHKGFDLGRTWMVFAIRYWSEPQSAPALIFADCVELLHLQLKII